MKIFSPHTTPDSSGFTLVEFLILIGIIIVFALITFLGMTKHPNNFKRVKTSGMAFQIQTAVCNYYTEYSYYPVPKGIGEVDTYYPGNNAAAWAPMTIALCGFEDPAHPNDPVNPAIATIPNERHIVYLAPHLADLDTSSGVGVLKSPYKDHNGKPQFFYMAIDSNYDNTLGDKDAPAGKLPDFANGRLGGAKITTGIAVWSNCDQDASDPANLKFWVYTY